MTLLNQVTPIVITWNEEPNVQRVFDKLTWANRVVVVDSGSTDATLDLLAGYPNVQVFTRAFKSHADQTNFALQETGIATEWVLSLDADYVLSDAFLGELDTLAPPLEVSGYSAAFEYWVLGRPLRASLYPPRVVLFRRLRGAYEQEGHAHRLRLNGKALQFTHRICHDDRKPLSRWLANQELYATLEAQRLQLTPRRQLDWTDRLRRTGTIAPVAAAAYCLLFKRCILDGPAGFHYTFQRTIAESLLAMRLWEMERPVS